MQNSDAVSILSYAFDCPCVLTHDVHNLFSNSVVFNNENKHRLRVHACSFSKLLFWGSRPPQRMEKILETSIAARKCLCVSGKMVLMVKTR